MAQTMEPSKGNRVKGSLLILGAIGIGVGSGLGLNFFIPNRGESTSAVAHAEDSEPAEQSEVASAAEATGTNPDSEASAPSASASEATDAYASDEVETSQSTVSETASIEAEPESASVDSSATGVAESPQAMADTAVTESAPEPQTVAKVAATAPKKMKRALPPPAAQVLRSWWTSTAADPFAVEYVGQVQGQRAIAVLFSRNVNDPAGNLKLIGTDGKAVEGDWKAGNSPRLLVHSNLRPGRYTVLIEQQLASADGQNLRAPLRGPIYVQ